MGFQQPLAKVIIIQINDKSIFWYV